MEVTLRPALPSDEDFLCQIYASSRMDEMRPLGWDEEQIRQFLLMQFKAQSLDYNNRFPDAQFDVILANQKPVGRLYVDRRANEIRILDICLLPEYRNKGIGTPLIQKLLHEAQESELSVGVYVETYNPSRRLFERLGFNVPDIKNDDPLLLLEWCPPSNCYKQTARGNS